MKIEEIKNRFRHPSPAAYPELACYSREQIYQGKMGPGGLYLAVRMIRRLRLAGGERVLDLGCGQGATSVFLAKECAAAVVAVDLWVSSTKLHRRFQRDAVNHAVVPLNLDITGRLPFAEDYFDAIFCMDSIHYYGGTAVFWQHLLPHLKPGGRLCTGSPCFNEEFSTDARAHLPPVYDDGTDLWPMELSRYHSPSWWANLISQTGLMCAVVSEELDDGVILWEDDVLDNLDNGGDCSTAAKHLTKNNFTVWRGQWNSSSPSWQCSL